MIQFPVSACHVCPLGSSTDARCPFTPNTLPAGAVITAQGERSYRVGFVREGVVSLTRVEEDGSESVSLRGPRSFLMSESLRGDSSPFEVRALSEVRLCSLESAAAADWIGPPTSPARKILDLILGDLEQRQRDVSWRSGDAVARTARFLLTVGLHPPGVPPLQKQLVARLLGMRPETLSRALRYLSDHELIERGAEGKVKNEAELNLVAQHGEAHAPPAPPALASAAGGNG